MTFNAGSIEASMTLDRDPFQHGLDAARKEVKEFQAQNGIKVSAELDDGRFHSQLTDLQRQVIQAGKNTINIATDIQTATFDRKYASVEQKVKSASASRIAVGFDLNDKLADTKFAEWRVKVAAMDRQSIDIDVDVSTAGAEAHLKAFEAVSRDSGRKSGLGVSTGMLGSLTKGAEQITEQGAMTGARFGSSFVGQTGEALSALKPLVIPILIGALVGVMPAVGALAGGALVSGLAFGMAGLGILVAAKTKAVKNSFKNMADYVKNQLKVLAQPFEPMLKHVAAVAKTTFATLAPSLGSAFNVLAPALSDFTTYLGRGLAQLAPVLKPVADAFSQMTAALGPQIPGIFRMIAGSLMQMANIIKQNPQFFAGMLASILKLLPYALGFIATLMKIALWMNHNATAVKTLTAVLTGPIVALTLWGSKIPALLAIIGGAFASFGRGVRGVWRTLWGWVKTFATNEVMNLWGEVNIAFHGVGNAFSWMGRTARSIWRAMWSFLASQARGMLGTIRAIVNAAFHGIGSAFSWMGTTAKNIWNSIWHWVSSTTSHFLGVIRGAINASFHGVAAAFTWMRTTARGIWNAMWSWVSSWAGHMLGVIRGGINTAFHGIGSAFSWMGRTARSIWNSMFGWLSNKTHSAMAVIRTVLNNALHGFANAFTWAKNAISSIWQSIQKVVAKPVNFVIETVYNQHLRKWANTIASAVGLGGKKGWLPVGSPVPGYAKGGVVGYAGGGILPGSSSFRSGDDQLVPMRRGEGVYVSEAMRNPYERARLAAVNQAAMHGKSLGPYQSLGAIGPTQNVRNDGGGFATGGIIGDGLGWLGNAMNKVKNFGANALGKLKGIGEKIVGKSVNWLYSHGPKQAIDGMLNPLAKSSQMGNVISKVPESLISSMIKKLQASADLMGGGQGQAADVIKKANSYIGTKEHPMGSNRQIFGQRFGMNGVAWCAEFISEVFKEAGAGKAVPHSAAVAAFNGSHLKHRSGKPVPGDLFTYGNSHINLYTGPGRRTVGGNQSDAVTADTAHFGRRSATLIPNYKKGTPGGGANLGGANAYYKFAKDQMAQMGMSVGYNWPSLYRLWMGESHWNPNARNPSSGAGGIPQALPFSKIGPGRNNAGTQISWGLRYIKSRYGNPVNAYRDWLSRSPHWYDSGGDLKPGGSMAWNGTNKTESVVTAPWREQQERVLAKIDAMLDQGQQPMVGNYTTAYYGTGDTAEAMKDLAFTLRKLRMETR